MKVNRGTGFAYRVRQVVRTDRHSDRSRVDLIRDFFTEEKRGLIRSTAARRQPTHIRDYDNVINGGLILQREQIQQTEKLYVQCMGHAQSLRQ